MARSQRVRAAELARRVRRRAARPGRRSPRRARRHAAAARAAGHGRAATRPAGWRVSRTVARSRSQARRRARAGPRRRRSPGRAGSRRRSACCAGRRARRGRRAACRRRARTLGRCGRRRLRRRREKVRSARHCGFARSCTRLRHETPTQLTIASTSSSTRRVAQRSGSIGCMKSSATAVPRPSAGRCAVSTTTWPRQRKAAATARPTQPLEPHTSTLMAACRGDARAGRGPRESAARAGARSRGGGVRTGDIRRRPRP